MLEAAASARIMDVDAMICFTYDARPEAKGLSFFDVRRDPCRWGLLGLASRLYLGDDLSAGPHTVAVGCSWADTFYGGADPRRDMRQRMADDVYTVGWLSPVRNLFFDQRLGDRSGADLVVASGLTPIGRYDVSRAVIQADADGCQPRNDAPALLAANNGYEVGLGEPGLYRFLFTGFLYGSEKRLTRQSPPPFVLDSAHGKGYQPIGADGQSNATCGFADAANERWVFSHLERHEAPRAALDALGALYGGTSHESLDTRAFVALGGAVVRDERRGLLRVDTPRFQAIAGALVDGTATVTSQLRLTTKTPIGALAAVSLDGQPLLESSHWVVKFVSFAVNTAERKAEHARDQWRGTIYALTAPGTGPLLTYGTPAAEPTVVSIGGRPVVEAYLTNGIWELVREDSRYVLYCDTPAASFRLPGAPESVRVVPYGAEGAGAAAETTQPVSMPDGAHCLEIRSQ
jgi:hypothetical protein